MDPTLETLEAGETFTSLGLSITFIGDYFGTDPDACMITPPSTTATGTGYVTVTTVSFGSEMLSS